MLRIHDVFRQERQGTVRLFVLMETDVDNGELFLKFLRLALSFAEEYFRKVHFAWMEKRPDPEGDRRRLEGTQERAGILAEYRSIPGRRADRLKRLQERLSAQGRGEPLSRLQMLLSLANAEERKALRRNPEVNGGHIAAAEIPAAPEQEKPGEVRPCCGKHGTDKGGKGKPGDVEIIAGRKLFPA